MTVAGLRTGSPYAPPNLRASRSQLLLRPRSSSPAALPLPFRFVLRSCFRPLPRRRHSLLVSPLLNLALEGVLCFLSARDSFKENWPIRTSTTGVNAGSLPDRSTSGSATASCRAFSQAYHLSVNVCLIARCVSLICAGCQQRLSPRDITSSPIWQSSGACNIAQIRGSSVGDGTAVLIVGWRK